MNTDTPLPPDEPGGMNPPEGAIINYYLKSAASGPVTLEVLGADGKLVRRYSSDDPGAKLDPRNQPVPLYWFRPPQVLSTDAGMHRFMWDMHYQPLPAAAAAGAAAARPADRRGRHNTVPAPTTPWVPAGDYTVKLTVNGKTLLAADHGEAGSAREDAGAGHARRSTRRRRPPTTARSISQDAVQQARNARTALATKIAAATGAEADALKALDKKIETLLGAPAAAEGGGRGGRGGGAGGGRGGFAPAAPDSLTGASTALAGAMNSLGVDVQPTALTLAALKAAQANGGKAMAQWDALKAQITRAGVRTGSH